ncbi:unnamed protein product, partial [Heterosigma akashiwo]
KKAQGTLGRRLLAKVCAFTGGRTTAAAVGLLDAAAFAAGELDRWVLLPREAREAEEDSPRDARAGGGGGAGAAEAQAEEAEAPRWCGSRAAWHGA